MNSTIAKLADEFEKMEKTIASQKKMIETLMPTGYRKRSCGRVFPSLGEQCADHRCR